MFGSNAKRSIEEQLRAQIQELNAQLEQLNQSGELSLSDSYEQAKNRARALLQQSREQLRDSSQQLQEYGQAAGQHARRCIREHPVGSLALGLGACALLCWLLRR